jgi:pSer/pThr/pTyr-binding forkhead associated (FHA) protein
MATILLTQDGTVLQEMTITKERTTIGRRPHNDVVIDNLTISGEHAVIVTILKDSFLEDLNSTNGTLVNGQPVKKHFLQNNDIIALAKYKIKYLVGTRRDSNDTDQAQPRNQDGERHMEPTASAARPPATIKVLDGASAGKELLLAKTLTTLGRPGVQVAAVTRRRPEGYFITHIEGDRYPLVNGLSIGADAHALADGDVIDLSGTRMAFSL